MQALKNLNSLEWNDLRLILAIARTGSLSGAAKELKNDHSTIFRKLNGIEKRTSVRFFERLNGRYEITEAGGAALKLAQAIETDVLDLERELVGRDARLRGNIRISAPEGPAVTHMPKVLAGFRQKYPDVTLELMSKFGPSDLARREADVALRITKSPPDSHLGRYICDFAFCAYGAPAYLERAGSRALEDYDWVVFEPTASWSVPAIFPTEDVRKARTVLSTNSVHTAVAAAEAGVGALAISAFLVDAHSGLLRIAGPFDELSLELWVLAHPDLRHTARVTALMDHVARQLRMEKELFEGRAGDVATVPV